MLEYCSQDITTLAKALIEVQKQMAPATKDADNPFTKSKYATLNSVMESCRGALLANGIWLTQLPVPAPLELGPGHIGLLTKLTHAESGQWQSSLVVAPLPKHDPQGMGSAITYCRRYALTAMLGMVTEDDDAEAAKIPAKSDLRQKNPGNVLSSKASRREQGRKTSRTVGQVSPFQGLPQLEGIGYEIVAAQDGRNCVIATGDTLSRGDILTEAGFRWNPNRQIWWKYEDAS